jgi:hypothetical protein
MSISSSESRKVEQQHSSASRTAPRVPQTPIPGLGLDSIAPGLGTQTIPDALVKVIDSRRFAATVDVDGEHLNVAYTDSDDLAMFVLEHPGSCVVSPQEAVDAFHRRLNAATEFVSCDEDYVEQDDLSQNSSDDNQDLSDSEPDKSRQKKASFQTGSEVDRRLRLMLFLSAHLGEEFPLDELAVRFIGKPKSEDELRRFVAILHKDINTLTTVSDDGEMAGSQFFDIDWSLLEAEGIVSATNSLGLERLAGVSQQYMSMLTASVNYLAHSPLLPVEQRDQAKALYMRLRRHVRPGETPWLSLTGYEVEPRNCSIVRSAINAGALIDMEYTDGAGRTRRKVVAPSKIFVDEGVYYVAVWTDVENQAPEDKRSLVAKDTSINKANGLPRIWQVLRVARIEHAEVITPVCPVEIPDVPISELRKWSFDNGTQTCFITDEPDLNFLKSLSGATVEPCGSGVKVHLTVCSDSWFVAFCIAHARHIKAVSPETLRTMIIARAQRELSVDHSDSPIAEN